MRRGLKVMVAVPSHDAVSALFTYDLAQLMGYTGVNFVGPDEPIAGVSLVMLTNTYIHQARQTLANMALEAEADYVLWLDADMRFPKNALIHLLGHNKDIVGINYSRRSIPPEFVAVKSISPPELLVTGPDSTGLEKVDALGFGCVLMRTRVLRALPPVERLGHPWFWHDWTSSQKHVGEDVYFCRLVREAGIDVYVDHDLSKECAHVGAFEYTLDHSLAVREEAGAPA